MKLDFQIGPVNKAGLQIFSILALSWVTSSGNCGYYAAVLCVQYTLYPQTQTAGNKITKLRQRPDPRDYMNYRKFPKGGSFPIQTNELHIFMTQFQDEFRSLSGSVTEILTACRMLQISIAWCQNDAEIRGFPTMYMNGGG